ncbi:uncharacterized protein LOC111403445 [Olea europaea var. sylvestris]|uniref:uncharacterized protein LOC111403445 n=1 Tax=Olea europaea var. sylvestris TaxID=158386 RepID=UPI000C1CCE11|nr:uncharacterized protein LOC111403445 [Olea europaea var. sylvestris]
MAGEKAKQTITHLEGTLAELFHETRAQTKIGKTQLVTPLKKFFNKGKMKIAFKKPNSHSTEKTMSSVRSSCSGSISSGRSLFGSPHATSQQKWEDDASSEESLEPVMVTEATSGSDDQIQQMALAIEKLTKSLEDKDAQIAALVHRPESQNPPTKEDQENSRSSKAKELEVQKPQQKQNIHDRTVVQNMLHDTTQLSVGSLSVQQLQYMIANTIRAQDGGSLQSSLVYAKPYSCLIDEIKMPLSYQPSKFQCFDDKGNPKQHVAHLIETCNNADTYNDTW